MYRRILVAVDGSEASNKAIAAAVEMASYGSDPSLIRLIHVLDQMVYYTAVDAYSGTVEAALRESGQAVLADGLARAQSGRAEVDTVLVDTLGAHLAETVAAQAKKWNASLLVVGTHGRRGVSRLLMGSGAEQIIRLAPCPVLVVRSPESAEAALP